MAFLPHLVLVYNLGLRDAEGQDKYGRPMK